MSKLKLILLVLFNGYFTNIFAINADFIIDPKGQPLLYCSERAWQQPDANGYCSSYEVNVKLPECDTLDSQVKFIITSQDWGEINSPTKRIFCVHPGIYQNNGIIELTESGTVDASRIIRFYDPDNPTDDVHPAQKIEINRAVIGGLHFNGANHWVVQGLTIRSTATVPETIIKFDTGQSNIVDKVLVEGGGGGSGQVNINGLDNVLQNSVLRRTLLTPGFDAHCLLIIGTSKDIRVINNEIYDCGGDAIQISSGQITGLSAIENNDLYITPDLYKDCAGISCACAENAIDFKGGGTKGEPLLILNNRNWGFRQTDISCSGSGSGGVAMTLHGDAQYILIQNNTIFDTPGGIHTANLAPNHISIIANVISNLLPNGIGIGQLHKANAFEVYYNTLIDAGNINANIDHEIKCNTTEFNDNKNSKLCLRIKRWTTPIPEQICIDKGYLEQASLSRACQLGINEIIKGVGIDDYRIWKPEGIKCN